MKRAAIVLATLALAGCATEKPALPPPAPRADMCILYQSYRYSPPAAAVEDIDALAKHNANEAGYLTECLLDPKRTQGPR